MGKEIAVKGLIVASLYMLCLSLTLLSIANAKVDAINDDLVIQGDSRNDITNDDDIPLIADTEYNESIFEDEEKLNDLTAKKSTTVVRELWNTVRLRDTNMQSPGEGIAAFWLYIKLIFIWFPTILFSICLIYSLPFF